MSNVSKDTHSSHSEGLECTVAEPDTAMHEACSESLLGSPGKAPNRLLAGADFRNTGNAVEGGGLRLHIQQSATEQC